MRFATLGLLTVLASAPLGANAADLDYGYLRGSDDAYAAPALIDWSGVYVGGHGGYSSSSMGYTNVFQPALANYLRNSMIEQQFQASSLLALPSQRVDGATYGAFAGYNVQFDDIVVGAEVDYTHLNFYTESHSPQFSRYYNLSNNTIEYLNLQGSSATKLLDYGTIRGRAGYAMGSFLPFVTAGVAIGRAKIVEGALVQHYQTFETPPILVGAKDTTKTMAGVALGAGLEYAITPSILLRGEYQYVLFDDFDRHKINVNTVRGGAAVKF